MKNYSYLRRSTNHGRDVGSSVTWLFRLGRVHLNVERSIGVYGFPETVSYSLRWWRA